MYFINTVGMRSFVTRLSNFCNLWCNSSVRTCPVKKGISSVSSVSSKYNVSVNVSKILIL